MNLAEYMIEATKAASEEAFRYAKAVPEDRIEWQPLEAGRSTLDLCRELAMCPGWAVDIITDKPQPEWNEETVAAVKREQEAWKTIDDCQAECNRRLNSLYETFRNLTDEDMKRTKWLPYDGGRDFTMPEMMDYPRWNFNYHTGQIAYIQTLLGDREMH